MRYSRTVAVVLVILMVAHTGWRVALNRRVGTDLIAAGHTASEFVDALRTGDFEGAYDMTSFRYSMSVGIKGLEELPRNYPAMTSVPDPGAVGLQSRRLEHTASRHFMFPKVPVPKNDKDYLPVVIKMTVGYSGDWKVSDVVIYE